MITTNSIVKINVPSTLSRNERDLVKEKFASTYNVPSMQIEVIPKLIKNNSYDDGKTIQSQTIDLSSLNEVYENYLDNNPLIDKELFYQIDKSVCTSIKINTNNIKNKYNIRYVTGKNILSFNDFQIDLSLIEGMNFVKSNPENFGGKSNFTKLFQILLWGKYFKAHEYSQLKDIMNRYSLSQDAFIEGLFSVNNDSYFIIREFERKKNKVQHKLSFYKLCDKNQADTYLYHLDGRTHVSSLSNDYKYDEGFYGKNLHGVSGDDAQTQIENLVGTIDEFINVSVMDEFTVNSLLLSTPMERTRKIYNLFGGDQFELKRDEAKRLLKKYTNDNNLKDKSIDSLNHELNQLNNDLLSLNGDEDFLLSLIKEKELEKESLLNGINTLKSSIVQLRTDIHDMQTLIEQRRKNSINLDNFYLELNAINSVYTNNEINFKLNILKSEKTQLTEKLSLLSHDNEYYVTTKNYQNKITSLYSNQLTGDKNIDAIINSIRLLNDLIEKARYDYTYLNEELKKINEEINNFIPVYNCNICNKEITYSNDHLLLKRDELNTSIIEVKDKGIKLKEELNKFTNDKQSLIDDINKMLEDFISLKEQELKSKKDTIKKHIEDLENQIDQLNDLLSNNSKKETLLIKIDQLNNLKNTIDEQINYLQNNNNIINQNLVIEEKIKILNNELLKCKSELETLNIKYYQKTGEVKSKKEQIDKLNGDIIRVKSFIKKEQAYIDYIFAHDKDGIIKQMIATIIPKINEELSVYLNDLDFEAYIDFVDDKYLSFFYKKDGKTSNLKDISGCERYLILCALYLVNIHFSRLQLSNIIVFDEVFGNIANVNLESVYKIIENYNTVFENVFIITHRSDIELENYGVIEIKKENNISKILI